MGEEVGGGIGVSLPVTISALSIEIKALHLADTAPTPADGYEIVQVKDLGFSKLWMESKVVYSTG